MKKQLIILFFIFLSSYAQAHTSHYEGIIKIDKMKTHRYYIKNIVLI